MVTGDHLDGNARFRTLGDGLFRLRPRRIHQSHQADERQPVDPGKEIAGGVERACGDRSRGDQQPAKPSLRERQVFGIDPLPIGRVQRPVIAFDEPAFAARQQDVWRTLDERGHLIVMSVKSSHELVRRVEGDLGEPRQPPGNLVLSDASLCCQDQQRRLRRVANHLSIVDAAVVAGDQRDQERGELGILRTVARRSDRALRPVAFARYLEAFPLVEERPRGHLIEGEGACLVRTDDCRASQGLHARQALDDGALSRHLVHAEREGDRDNDWQPFRHGGDGQRDRVQSNVRETGAAQHFQEGQQAHQSQGDRTQALAEPVELNLQWGGRLRGRNEFLRQPPHLGVRACGRDDELGAPAREHRVHVGHVDPVAERSLQPLQGRGLLADRL